MPRDPHHPKSLTPTHVVESPRHTPIRADVDVLVCGGGPAGVGAALAAAREGARTVLVERHAMLGGMWTAGLVNPFFEAVGRGFLVAELTERLQAEGAWQRWKWAHTFDPEVMRRTLEALMEEAGVELLYQAFVVDSIVEGGVVRGAVLESKAGREAITARVTVDATGDGDVAARAGCAYEFGREADGYVQPMTLMFAIEGAGRWEQESAPWLWDRLHEAIEERQLGLRLPVERCGYAPWIIHTPGPGTAAAQWTHVYRLNPLDPRDLALGVVEARRQAAEAVAMLQRLPGLEGVRLAGTAPTIGVRESRRIVGRYRLTLEDLLAGRRFADGVTACAFGIDIHQPSPGSDVPAEPQARSRPYEIPYRSLLPADVSGLLVAGRCLSGSHEAHASYRVTGTAMATGQAAGLAAAWAAADGVAPEAIPGDGLRRVLRERGAVFLDG